MSSRKSKRKETKKIKKNNYNYQKFLICILCLLLFIPPFFRGLFFDYPEHMLYSILVSLVFIGFILWYMKNKKEECLIRDKQETLQILFVLIYIVNIIFGINKDGSIHVFLRLWTYILIYWMVSRTFDNIKKLNILFWCLYIAGVILSLTPISSALGIHEFISAYDGTRFQSTIQYANSFAIYMVVVNIVGYYLYNTTDNVKYKLLLILSNILVFMGFIGSLSRGAWLIYPIVIALYFILCKTKKNYLIYFSYVWLGGTIAYILSFVILINVSNIYRLLIIFFVTGVITFLYYINDIYLNTKKWLIPGLMFLIVFTICIAKNELLITVLGSSLNRIINIDFGSIDALSRIAFWKDAINMALDRPVLGFGGQGWQSGYMAYQNHLYFSTEVHNHWLQVLIESGFIGLIIFAMIWLMAFIKMYKVYRTEKEEYKCVIATVGCSLLGLAMHIVLDFDFSIGSLYILFWVLVAISSSLYYHANPVCENKMTIRKKIAAPMIFITSIIILLVCTSFSIANNQFVVAVRAETNGEMKEAEQHFIKATRLNTWSAKYLSAFGRFYFNYAIENDNNELLSVSLRKMEKAILYDEMNSSLRLDMARMYFTVNKLEESINEMEKCLEYQKMSVNNYRNLINANFTAGMEMLKRGDKEKAEEYFSAVFMVEKRMKEEWDNVTPERKKIWSTLGFDKLINTTEISLDLAKSAIALNNLETAKKYLSEAEKSEKLKDQFLLWKAIYYEKCGEQQQKNECLELLREIEKEKINDYIKLIEILKR